MPEKTLAQSLPRGIPAASLKLGKARALGRVHLRLPRGIPAASLKQRRGHVPGDVCDVFRGEYSRPH